VGSNGLYYEGLRFAKQLENLGDLNQHLQEGWKLLKFDLAQETVSAGNQLLMTAKPFIVVGQFDEATRPPLPKPTPPPSAPAGFPPPAPAYSGPRGPEVPCRYCPQNIWFRSEGGRRFPMNPNGAAHTCNRGTPT